MIVRFTIGFRAGGTVTIRAFLQDDIEVEDWAQALEFEAGLLEAGAVRAILVDREIPLTRRDRITVHGPVQRHGGCLAASLGHRDPDCPDCRQEAEA